MVGGQDGSSTNCEGAEKYERRCDLGVKPHGVKACTLGQVAECREMNGESVFPWPGDTPNRQRWVNEGSSYSVDRKTAEHDLCAVSMRLVDDMHRKCGAANGSLESEQAEDGLIRVDLSSDSRSMEVPEDAQEQSRPVSPREQRWEGPPTPPSEHCEAVSSKTVAGCGPVH